MAAKSVTHSVSLMVGDISLNFSDTITSADTATSFAVQSQVIAHSTTPATLVTGEVDTSSCNTMIIIRNDEAVQTGANTHYKNLNVSLDNGSNYDIIVKPQTSALFSIGSKDGSIGDLTHVKVLSGGNNESVEFRYMLVQTEVTS